MDADGLSNVSYTYQWIRVATDSTETDISGATSSAYTLVADDEGKTIKVKVSFSDDANNAENADQRGDGGRGGGAEHRPHRVGPHGDHERGHGLHVRRGQL